MKTGVLYLVTDFLIKALQFALLPLASAALPLEQYAELTLYMTVITAATPLLTMSAEAAYSIYFNPRNDDADRNVYLATLVVALVSAAFWVAVGLVVITAFGVEIRGGAVSIGAWLLIAFYIFVDMVVRVEILGRRLGFRHIPFAVVSIAYQIAKFAVAVPLLFWFGEAQWYVLAIAGVSSAFAAVLWRYSGMRPRQDRETVKLVLRYTLKIAPASLMAVANNSVDRIMVVSLLGTLELAYYHSVFVLAGMIQVLVLTLNKIHVSKLLADFSVNKYTFLDQPPHELRIFALLWFGTSVLAILLGGPAFAILFEDAIQFDFTTYSILCWNFSIFGFYIAWANVLSLEERTAHLKVLGYAIAVVPSIALSYFLTKSFGGTGAASAALTSNVISALVLFVLVRRVTGTMYFFREFIVFVLAAVALESILLQWLA